MELNGRPKATKEQVEVFADVVANALMVRQEFLKELSDPRRNLEDECGYPPLGSSISVDLYRQLYDRMPIATRVVQCMPKESWQGQPTVFESDDSEEVTEFEEAWDDMQLSLTGKTWHQDEKGSPIWGPLLRADILSGIGHFGVLLLGIDDGKGLETPIEGAVTTNWDHTPTMNSKEEQIGWRMIPVSKSPILPDGYLTSEQEKSLLDENSWKRRSWTYNNALKKHEWQDVKLPPLSSQEKSIVANWVREREMTLNKVATPTGRATDSSGKELFSQDLMGTDAQYFGVQFGESERASDTPSKKKRKLLFLRPFPEDLVQIVRYEWNINNPRFGQPVMYRITLSDPREQQGGIGLPMASVFVHWTRVIHIADNLGSSEVNGVPRMQPVLDHLLALKKIYGASAEGYWKSCFSGVAITTHPQLGGDVNVNVPELKDMVEDYQNGLQRFLLLMGMGVQTLAPSVVDPTSHINVHIEAICIQLGIPIPVFKGYEIGEQASQNNDETWADRKAQRRNEHITPNIIVALVDRLISIAVLPEPEGFTAEWPEFDALSATEKATNANTRVTAMSTYVQGGVNTFMSEHDFLVRELGYDEADAITIEENATKAQEEELKDQQALADQHGMIPEPPPGFQHPEPTPPEPPKNPITIRPGEKVVHPDSVKPNKPQFGNRLPAKNANPNHDEKGRFASAETGAMIGKDLGSRLNDKAYIHEVDEEEKLIHLQPIGMKNLMHAQTIAAQFENKHSDWNVVVRDPLRYLESTENVFCPTGAGGGIDSSCSPGGASIVTKADGAVDAFMDMMEETESDDPRMTEIGAAVTDEHKKLYAVSDGKLVGAMSYAPTKTGKFDLHQLGSIQKGAGSSLVRQLQAKGKPVIARTVRDEAKKFYEKMGFRHFAGTDMIWTPVSTKNVFCPTGTGGGIDATCSPGGEGGSSSSHEGLKGEPKAAPPPGPAYKPNVEADRNGDGVTDAARIGVPGMSVPPPPGVGKLPNLTPHERAVESEFMNAFHKDPDGMASKFLAMVHAASKPGEPPTFGTDDAKNLSAAWTHPEMSLQDRSENRATLNCALHQTANAIAKRAFVQHLDTLQPGDNIMVTVGGCGAGKGYSLGKVPEVLAMKNSSKAVWDSAGDQNATENPWIQKEAEARGLKVTYAFVHADPATQWAHPERGVVKRAGDPKDGRMVDADVFADSYAIGAKNHQAFYEKNKNNPSAKFEFLAYGQKIPGIPKEALELNRHSLAVSSRQLLAESGAPPHVVRGGMIGTRIWGTGDYQI